MSRSAPPEAAATAADDFPPTASRPASLWPETTRQGDGSTGFAPSRFDPLADERAQLQAQAAMAFDVCHPALALRAVLLVQAVLAVAAIGTASSAADWGQRQAALAFGGAAATLLWLVLVCALRPLLGRAGAPWRAALVMALGAGTAVAAWAPLWWAGLATDAGGLRIASLLLTGAGLAALLWAWLDLRSRIWQPAHARARLQELQSRIRPHFLFNALNTALALVRVDPPRAEAVLEDLSELFRVALAETGVSVSLREEIELARRYLEIEQIRFGPRLQVEWDIEPRTWHARIPPLVLQPLVENAVRHGVEPVARGGRVTVRTQVQRAQAVVTVVNTVGTDAANPGHGMALHNVRERLRLLHDVAALCETGRHTGADGAEFFQVRIVLPLP